MPKNGFSVLPWFFEAHLINCRLLANLAAVNGLTIFEVSRDRITASFHFSFAFSGHVKGGCFWANATFTKF